VIEIQSLDRERKSPRISKGIRMIKIRRSAGIVAIAASATMILAACGGSSTSTEETATEEDVVVEEEATTGGEALRVTYIPKNLGNPYFDAIVKGFNETAPGLNMTVEVVAPAQAGATDQIPFIDAAIQQEVDAIAISPNDADALCPSLKRAMYAGIIVLTVNGDTAVDCRQASITPVDFSQLGKYLVDLTASVTGGEGEWAFLSATSTAPDQNTWLEGAAEYIASGASPAGLTLVDTVFGDDAPDKSATEAQALLTKFPNLAAINAPTTVGIAAAAQVLSQSPRKGQVQVTGLGTPNQMREFIKDGTVQKFALWDPALQGVIAANLIAGIKSGAIVPGEQVAFEVPGVGERIMAGADRIIIAGPPQEFDATNIDDFDF